MSAARRGIRAALSSDRKTVLMRGGTYKGDFPVEKLDFWLGFYTKERDHKGGKYKGFYSQTVEDLERVKGRLK